MSLRALISRCLNMLAYRIKPGERERRYRSQRARLERNPDLYRKCKRDSQRAYRERNRDKVTELNRLYRERNRDRINERQRARRDAARRKAGISMSHLFEGLDNRIKSGD